ncbi:MAG: RraA family protein [Alphaproteobacteria bacterium]
MDLVARLENIYTGVAHDVMRGMGLSNFTLPPEIRPLFPEQTLAGVVSTVSGKVDRSADAHTTLYEWTGLLSKAKPDTVMICQPNDSVIAHMGELSAEVLKLKGVRGYVVDGGCRDVNFIIEQNFPVWYRYHTPRDVVGYWLPDQFEQPITIGEVAVNPGDYVLGDRDGMVILPKDQAEAIVDAAETAVATENKVRTAILDGMDPQEAYLKYGKF